MPSTVDGLLVALFVALAPPDQESPLPAATDSLRQEFQQGYEGLKLGAEGDAARCRYYVNATARGNCVARMKRSLSGAPDIPPAFPNETIWIAPGDPGMPIKFHPNTLR